MKGYIQDGSGDNLFTQAFKGSLKKLEKLQKVYSLMRPFALEQLKQFRKDTSLGRLGHDPEILFKMLFLEHMFAMSDNEVIEATADTISFRKFMRINKETEIPSRRALVQFRKEFFTIGCPNKMFKEILGVIEKQDGLLIRSGTMIDSQIVSAQGFKSPAKMRRDRNAKITCKSNQVRFGYKMHIGVDKKSKIIKKHIFTTANVNDSKVADKLIDFRNEIEVYGDKGYTSDVRDARYEQKGINNCVMRKRKKGQKRLSKRDKDWNKVIAKTRARVEHVFGRIVQEFKYDKARYYNRINNNMASTFVIVLYNIKVCAKNNYITV